MAIFTFNRKQTAKLKMAILCAPEGHEVYFQPTHHGGCIQVLKMKENSHTKWDYCEDIYKSRVTGYKTFCNRLSPLRQDVIKLTTDWTEFIATAKTIRFKVCFTKDDKISYTLSKTS